MLSGTRLNGAIETNNYALIFLFINIKKIEINTEYYFIHYYTNIYVTNIHSR